MSSNTNRRIGQVQNVKRRGGAGAGTGQEDLAAPTFQASQVPNTIQPQGATRPLQPQQQNQNQNQQVAAAAAAGGGAQKDQQQQQQQQNQRRMIIKPIESFEQAVAQIQKTTKENAWSLPVLARNADQIFTRDLGFGKQNNNNNNQNQQMRNNNNLNSNAAFASAAASGGGGLNNNNPNSGDHFKQFSKAATFVENSTKVWAHRVDSTHTLSIQMLNRLRRNDAGKDGGDDKDGKDGGGGGKDGKELGKKKKRALQRTLAESVAEINADGYSNPETSRQMAGQKGMRVTYGAMFAAMTQKFDQGFKGLLLNNAPIGREGNPYLDRDFSASGGGNQNNNNEIDAAASRLTAISMKLKALNNNKNNNNNNTGRPPLAPPPAAVGDVSSAIAAAVAASTQEQNQEGNNNNNNNNNNKKSHHRNTTNLDADEDEDENEELLIQHDQQEEHQKRQTQQQQQQQDEAAGAGEEEEETEYDNFDDQFFTAGSSGSLDGNNMNTNNTNNLGITGSPNGGRFSPTASSARVSTRASTTKQEQLQQLQQQGQTSRAQSVAAQLSRAASVAGFGGGGEQSSSSFNKNNNNDDNNFNSKSSRMASLARDLATGGLAGLNNSRRPDDDNEGGDDFGDDDYGGGFDYEDDEAGGGNNTRGGNNEDGSYDEDGFALPGSRLPNHQNQGIIALAAEDAGNWLPLASQKGNSLRFGPASGNSVLNQFRKGTKIDAASAAAGGGGAAGSGDKKGTTTAAAAATGTTKKKVGFEQAASIPFEDLRNFDNVFGPKLKLARAGQQNVVEMLPPAQTLQNYTSSRFCSERAIAKKQLLPRASAFDQDQLSWWFPRSATRDVSVYYQPFCAPNSTHWNLLTKYQTDSNYGVSNAQAGGALQNKDLDAMPLGDDDFFGNDNDYDGDDPDYDDNVNLGNNETLGGLDDLGPNFAEEEENYIRNSLQQQQQQNGDGDGNNNNDDSGNNSATPRDSTNSNANAELLKLIEAPVPIDLGQFVIPANLTQINVVRLRACMWKHLEHSASSRTTEQNWEAILDHKDMNDAGAEDDDDDDDFEENNNNINTQGDDEEEDDEDDIPFAAQLQNKNAQGKRVAPLMSSTVAGKKNAIAKARRRRKSCIFSEVVLRMLPEVPTFVRGGSLAPAFFFFSLLFLSNEKGLLLVPLRVLEKKKVGSTHCEDVLVLLPSDK